ncbi:PucR family transcriptional regulator [Streptomyces fenghuangensis]|uniref:PucR family transcriptional regulator n=1 Tax=Streptomyces chitinivorans TaxID=1257027 RepID=A0ABW7HXS7_9ACTN|nr:MULTISPECIES: PucR family transcriptional regulator [Streptomyces]MCG3040914.1 PucR family transcriptional regulator ligand-binding domain-containing protein [Streptomyces sp. ICN903]MDH2409895.1 PucR family transcriptional regulator ligand-binding domain-containing protein [Streptomyces chitinivorans]
MRLRALLDGPWLGLRLLSGEEELDRPVRGVMTTDLRDPSRYLSGGELVLTGLAWRRGPEDSEPFVRILAAAGVAALAAGEAELGPVPADLVAACARHRLPLFSVDEKVAFATVTEHVVRQVSGERAGDLAAVVERHRRLMSPDPAGGGPDAVLDLLGSDLDLRAWVLSPAGRPVAGSGTDRLPAAVRTRLAGEHLAALRAGRPGPHRAVAGETVYSLFPVGGPPAGGEGADPREAVLSALSGWLLAVEADADEWPAERLDLLHGVTRLIAAERERRDAARSVGRRLAGEVLELLRSGAPSAEVAARLRVTASALLPGSGAAPLWQVVVARLDWEDGPGLSEEERARAAGALLEEALAGPAGGRDAADRVAVVPAGGEAVALVPLAAAPGRGSGGEESGEESGEGGGGEGSGPSAGAEGAFAATALLDALRTPLERGLDGLGGPEGRLTLGVSAAVHSAEGLRGALEEARHARRVAAARPGRVCAAGHEELASHVLLLPFVPDDVRRAFTARLLDPLYEYDRRHRAELVPTLEAFLASEGSWTRCAARLHLHVNTLRYRVGRIERLTGRDLSRLEDRVDFLLALRMR